MIKNLSIYNERMAKSIADKAFFIDKIPNINLLFDYGCADAELFVYLQDNNLLSKDCIMIGYDNSMEMIELAKNRGINNAKFFNNLNTALRFVEEFSGVKVLVLNSVLHELYSYSKPEQIGNFWKTLPRKFDYIVIRDMAIDIKNYSNSVPFEWFYKFQKNATDNEKSLLEDFSKRWKNPKQKAPFIHFLLKHTYTENWERELNENYFAFSDFLDGVIFSGKYDIRYFKRFTLPYFRNLINRKFNFVIDDATHFKTILKTK